MVSIYNEEKRLEGISKRIAEAESISKNNKNLIVTFRDECFAHNMGCSRITRYLFDLRNLSLWLQKDFDTCTIEDIKKVVGTIERMSQYGPRSKYEYRATLK